MSDVIRALSMLAVFVLITVAAWSFRDVLFGINFH